MDTFCAFITYGLGSSGVILIAVLVKNSPFLITGASYGLNSTSASLAWMGSPLPYDDFMIAQDGDATSDTPRRACGGTCASFDDLNPPPISTVTPCNHACQIISGNEAAVF